MEPISDAAVFVRVVEEGTFTAAAASLDLSKGAVSKYVSRLEESLGARLLNRTTRSLTLTEAGKDYYERAARALAELREAAEEVTEHAGSPRGHLRVAAPPFYASEILARHLCEFHRQFPDITLELLLENRLIDLVEQRVDVAIRMSAPEDSTLVMRKFADVPLVVCASPGYIERAGRPLVPRDLSAHQCLIYTVSPRPHQWPFVGKTARTTPSAFGARSKSTTITPCGSSPSTAWASSVCPSCFSRMHSIRAAWSSSGLTMPHLP